MQKKIITVICILIVIAIGVGLYLNTPVRRLQRQLELAQRYLENMDYDEAIAAFEAAIDIEPKSEEAYIGLADAYIAINESDKAIEILQTGYVQTSSTDIQNKLEKLTVQVENEVESEEQSETGVEAETEQIEESSEETESESDVLEVVAFEEREEYQEFETLESAIQEIVKVLIENTFESLDDIDVVEKMVNESEIPWQSESALYKTKDYKILTQHFDKKISFECQLDENEELQFSAEVRPENGMGYYLNWSENSGATPDKALWIGNCTNWQFNGECTFRYSALDEKLNADYYLQKGQIENNLLVGTWSWSVQNWETGEWIDLDEFQYDNEGHSYSDFSEEYSEEIYSVGTSVKKSNLADIYW